MEEETAGIAVRELALTELHERTGAVLAAVSAGEAAIVTRHGRPVAALVPLAERDSLEPLSPDNEALAELARRFGRRFERRRWSELMHGRWVNGGGIRGRYRRSPGRSP